MNKHISSKKQIRREPGKTKLIGKEGLLTVPSVSGDLATLEVRDWTAGATDRTADAAECRDKSILMPHVRDNPEWTLEYLLLGDLADLLSEGYDEENRKWLLVVLEGLLDAIPAEGRSERFNKLRRAYPGSRGLLQSLTQLEAEHDAMIFQLRRLRNRVAWRLSLLDVVAAEVVLDLKRWLMTFQSFCKREHRLHYFEEDDASRHTV